MGRRGRLERRNSPRLTTSEGRKFGLTVGAAFIVIGGLLTWRGHLTAAAACGSLGGGLCLAGLVIPRKLGPVQLAWMSMAHAISKVTTPVVMSIIYFLVITPAGWLVRLFRHQPLRRQEEKGSYWIERESPTGDLERQF